MTITSNSAAQRLTRGIKIPMPLVSSRTPVKWRNHWPRPTALNSATIFGLLDSFIQATWINTSASNIERIQPKAVRANLILFPQIEQSLFGEVSEPQRQYNGQGQSGGGR